MRTLAAPFCVALMALMASGVDAATAQSKFIRIDDPVIALQNVRVIDGTGAPPAEGQTVLIEGGRIRAVGSTMEIPAGARVLDLAGSAVMPGLVMLHEHLMYFSGEAVWHSQPVSYPKLYLAAGVTSLRTGGTEHPEVDLNLKSRIDAGAAPGPKLHLYFNGAAGDFLGDTVVRTAEEARAATAYWAGRGFTSFKLYDAITPDAARAVIDEAHRRKLTVTGHLASIGCAEAAGFGIDFIEHAFGSCVKDFGVRPGDAGFEVDPDDPKVLALMDALIEAGVVLVATPQAPQRRISDGELAMLHPHARARYLKMLEEPPPWLPDADALQQRRQLERAFVARGGKLALGSDPMDFGQIAGYANHRVLALLVDGGWTPLEAIRMATSGGAAALGIGDEVGHIAAGKAADLIVVDGNPAADITDLSKVTLVFKDGVGYDPDALRAAAEGLVGWH